MERLTHPNQKSARLNPTDFLIQLFLIFCLFFALTGGAFLIGWEQFRHFRSFHRFLSIALAIGGGGFGYLRYLRDKDTFFDLEPVRSIKRFFEMPAVWSVTALTFVYFATQLTYLTVMHAGLETSLWDLGIYDQAIWSTAHGNFLITSVRGGLHIFCEHFKPILGIFSPVYWITNSTLLLLMFYTLMASSSIAGTYLVSRAVTGSHPASLIFSLCAFFYRPMRNAVDFLFHTQVLADPFLLFGFFFALRNQLKRAGLLFCLALMCKENIATDVLGVGLFLVSRKQKGGWFATSLAVSFVALYVLIIEPYFRYPYHFFPKWNLYSHFRNPTVESWVRLLEPNPLVFLLLVFGPFLLLSFKGKSWHWLLGPSLGLRLLTEIPGLRMITAHYTGGLNALVFISAIYGFSSWVASRSGKSGIMLSSLIFSAFLFAGKPQLFAIDKSLIEASKPEHQRIVSILETIPPKYSVLTNERPSAHLSHRSKLFVFFSMFPHAPLEEATKHPDLIIEDTERIQDPERKALTKFVERGYRSVFEYGFIRIYASPALEVPQDLITEWNDLRQVPTVSYRSLVHFWYGGVLAVSVLVLFAIMGTSLIGPGSSKL